MLSEELQELNAKELIARANFKKGQIAGEKIGEKRGEKRGEKKGVANMSNLMSWLFSQDRVDDAKKAQKIRSILRSFSLSMMLL